MQIRPFENGNGRWSRLLANVWLKQNDQPIIAWPDEIIVDTSVIRGPYIQAVKSADNGNLADLIKLHARYSLKG